MTDAAPDGRSDLLDSDPTVYARRWLILAVLCLALLIVSLDNTILYVSLPSLASRLKASPTQLQWFVDAYTLVFASLLLTAGSLGDRFGRRGALLAGMAVFGGFSALAAFASSPAELMAARAVMGLGAAFMMPATLAILTNVFPAEERPQAIAIWAGVTGIGVGVGPLAGGFLLQHFWWGSIFLVNIPIVVVSMACTLALVPRSKNRDAPRVDRLGAGLSVVGLAFLLYAIIEGPDYGWTSGRIALTAAVGLAVLVAFIVWERRTDEPELQIGFFANHRFSGASLAIALLFFALFGSLFFLTQYFQDVLGTSPLQTGLRVAPVALALVVAAPATPPLVARLGTKVVVGFGLAICATSLILLSQARVGPGFMGSSGAAMLVVFLLGLGLGFAMAPATDSIMGSVPQQQAGVGSGVNDTTREFGGALGVAVLGSVMNGAFHSGMAGATALHRLPAAAQAVAERSIAEAQAVAAVVSTRSAAIGHSLASAAKTAFVNAMSDAAWVGVVVIMVGIAVTLLLLPAHPAGSSDVVRTAMAAAREERPRRGPVERIFGALAHAAHASLSFNAVSTRARVDLNALGRTWHARVRAVAEGLEEMAQVRSTPAGSLVHEVAALLRSVGAAVDKIGAPAFSRLVTADGPGRPAGVAPAVDEPQRQLQSLLATARTEGRLTSRADPAHLAEALLAWVHHHLLVRGGSHHRANYHRAAELMLAPYLVAALPDQVPRVPSPP